VSKYVDLAIITEMGNARNNVNVMSSNVVVVCGLMGAGTVSEVALALKAGKPVILVGATPAEEKFFKKLGGRLIAAVENPGRSHRAHDEAVRAAATGSGPGGALLGRGLAGG
jgi:uncharacterized protein (TIGR00725 family)